MCLDKRFGMAGWWSLGNDGVEPLTLTMEHECDLVYGRLGGVEVIVGTVDISLRDVLFGLHYDGMTVDPGFDEIVPLATA